MFEYKVISVKDKLLGNRFGPEKLEKAYEYVVNSRAVIEWVIDRHQIKTDKASGIVNDRNDWAKEVNNPRYILDLLQSVVSVSV